MCVILAAIVAPVSRLVDLLVVVVSAREGVSRRSIRDCGAINISKHKSSLNIWDNFGYWKFISRLN